MTISTNRAAFAGCLVRAGLALVPALLPAQGQPDPASRGPTPRPIAFAVRIPEGKTLDVDGSLIDWPELPMINLTDPRQISGTAHGAYREPSDAAMQAFMSWDDQFVYFGAAVKDDWHRALDPETLMLQETPVADSVVLSFDPARDTRFPGPSPGRSEDTEFWLSEEATQSLLVWDRLRGSARILEESAKCVVSHDKVMGVTTYEARIPWSEVLIPGTLVGRGLVFDLQVVLNDFDETTDPMPQTRIGWTFSCGAVVDPFLYGSVVLVDSIDDVQESAGAASDHRKVDPPEELTQAYWRDIANRLAANPPAVHDGSTAPAVAGGFERYEVLTQIERAVERMPRVDYVEYCQRVNRRMNREVLGLERYGLPWFWASQLRKISDAATEPPAAGSVRLFRLPTGGWLLRGNEHSLLVDPSMANVEDFLWGATNLVLLTEPLDMTRRNDQLLLRMIASKENRRFLTHIAFHIPIVSMRDMPLVTPQTTMGKEGGLVLRAGGRKLADGSVPATMGYEVMFPGGPRIVFVDALARPEEVSEKGCDALVLSPRNPKALEIVEAADPKLVILDETFRCSTLPNLGRLDLDSLHRLQQALLPRPSLILAPGESWSVGS